MPKHHAKKPREIVPFPEGFDPKPTVFKGGIKRMVAIFNTLRGQNKGGYGSGVVQQVGTGEHRWGKPGSSEVTSCSPFTATVLGMLFDPSGATDGDSFQPMYDDGQTPLPSAFYALHNSFYLGDKRRAAVFRERHWKFASGSTGSCLFFNLGYEIQAKDLRRGDMVGIDWSNGGGHATFVWDVHLDANGEVDAFCFVSSNGSIHKAKEGKGRTYTGAGITIGGCGGKHYLSGSRGSLKPALDPLFTDRPEHIRDAAWYMVPHRREAELDRSTFKDPGIGKHRVPDGRAGFHVRSLKAVRLWGIAPPDRAAEKTGEAAAFDLAKQLAYEDPPPSYATGQGKAPEIHIEKAPVTVQKGDVEKIKKASPKPAKQHAERPTAHQEFVEDALRRLFDAGWIDKDPGDAKNVNDAKTKDAIKDFQTKFDAKPIDGDPGPITRKAMRKALRDLADGKPGPKDPPKPTTHLDHVTWLFNRVDVGGETYVALHGDDVDKIERLTVTLKDRKGGHEAKVHWRVSVDDGIVTLPIEFPKEFGVGAEVLATFDGKAKDGAKISYAHDVPVYVGLLEPDHHRIDDEWPWDERKWTQKMRDIVADLRATKVPSGPFERFEITQYGVKEKIEPGDVEVRSDDGEVYGTVSKHSLMLADIEGTMRLNGRILNITHSGNVYEPREVIVDGKKVTKKKPVRDKFNPDKSRWHDVTEKAPWGSGSKLPLIPFRVLAINAKLNKHLYKKKVYIKQLDGLTMVNGEKHNGICIVGDCGGMRKEHFDFFVGREDHHIHVPSVSHGGATICEIKILD